MARLQSASIRLVQKLNRRDSSGGYPIYLVVCFHGRKEKALGISCLQKHWDARREEVRRGCPNAPVLNKMLSDIKQRVIDRRNGYELSGRAYTPSMLMEDCVPGYDGRENVFVRLMDSLIRERRLKWKTEDKYRYTYRKLCEFTGRDDFLVDEINVGFVKDFVRWLGGYVNDNSIRNILGQVASVWNYAIERGICESKDYPFREYRFTRKFPFRGRDYCIDLVSMRKLKEYFLDLVCIRDGDRWCYREGAYERLGRRTSREFGILYFLAMYYLNGSAPIDVSRLRVGDCSREVIDGEQYWRVEFKRQKSGTGVSIRLKRNMFSIILLEHFLGRSSGEYVYPIVTEKAKTEIQIIRCSNKCGESAIRWVRQAFEEINQETVLKNIDSVVKEPLVDVGKVVLYTARHSFASNYLNSPGATVMGAASLLARSANTISTYIHTLTNSRDIADAVSFLDE